MDISAFLQFIAPGVVYATDIAKIQLILAECLTVEVTDENKVICFSHVDSIYNLLNDCKYTVIHT